MAHRSISSIVLPINSIGPLPLAARPARLRHVGQLRRQVVDVEHAVDVEHDHRLDRVAQLAHVAGPVVGDRAAC